MRRSLEYIAGYLGLGMVREAREEWEKIPATLRDDPRVVDAQMAILYAAEAWPDLEMLSRRHADCDPSRLQHWINLAFAVRRTQGIPEAIQVLERAEPRFGPTSGILNYNLACYYCLSGRNTEAILRLRAAFSLEPELVSSAAADEDLRPLWPLLADGTIQAKPA